MTQDEIIEMAKHAGLVTNSPYVMPYEHELRGYVAFAKLVAAKEREACCADDIVNSANIMANDMPHTVIEKYQAAIRARGEA